MANHQFSRGATVCARHGYVLGLGLPGSLLFLTGPGVEDPDVNFRVRHARFRWRTRPTLTGLGFRTELTVAVQARTNRCPGSRRTSRLSSSTLNVAMT
jgi:hypothetical protein